MCKILVQCAERPSLLQFTCPICREEVKGSNNDTRAANLVDWFLGQYPQKGKSDESKREMDETYRPNDDVLPRITPPAAGPQRLADEEGHGEGRGSVISSYNVQGSLGYSMHLQYDLDEDDDSEDEDSEGEDSVDDDSADEQRELIDLVMAISLSTHDQETNRRQMETRFACEICDRAFLSERAAKQHMNDTNHRADRFVCETCDRTFRSERAAEQHMNDKNHWV